MRFAIASPPEFTLMFRTERLDQANQRLRAAGLSALGLAADAIGAFAGVASPMADPVLTRRVIGLWAQAQGIASLLLARQLGPLAQGEALARALVPDMVREMLGVDARNDDADLELISRASAAQ